MNHENLWAPWRMAYLRNLQRKEHELGLAAASTAAGSFLLDYWNNPTGDEANLVVYRNKHGLVLLNRYPYANGHLLAALGDARPTLLDYEPAQRAAFWRLAEIATELVQKTLSPQGINTGINEGKAAGAGVPEHLHAHIIPRWAGDTNFITVVGQIRVIPEALEAMAALYRETAARLRGFAGG
jgi:ATP adenylyltransferase